jgi:hypothetical protein
MKHHLLSLLAICGIVCATSVQEKILKAPLLRDVHKRSVIYHGVNIVYKVDPYLPSSDKFDPETSLTDAEIDNLVAWGFNFVRLGVMWEAVERSQGTFN